MRISQTPLRSQYSSASVPGYQAALILNRECKQVCVRDLLGSGHSAHVADAGLGTTQIRCPELMAKLRAHLLSQKAMRLGDSRS